MLIHEMYMNNYFYNFKIYLKIK